MIPGIPALSKLKFMFRTGNFWGVDIPGGSGEIFLGCQDSEGGYTEYLQIQDGATALVQLNLPTSDPAVAGQWWSDPGVVKVSAG